MKHSFRVAYGGMIVGLSLVAMFATALFPFAEYALPAIAGIFLIGLVVDFGFRSAVVAYVAVSLLSAVIVPNKEAAVLFIAFLGYYPILKGRLEQMKNRIAEWCVKFGIFNFAVLLSYYLMMSVFGLKEVIAEVKAFQFGIWVLLLLANVVFLIYDFALTRLISFFICRIRPKYIRNLNR
jgi:hypothetical protein